MLMFIQVTSQFYHFNFFGVPPIIFIGFLKKNIEPQKNRNITFSGVPQPGATSLKYPSLVLPASAPLGPAAHSIKYAIEQILG